MKMNIRSDIWTVCPWEKGGWLSKHHEGSHAQITVEFEQNIERENLKINMKTIISTSWINPLLIFLEFAPNMIWSVCADDMCVRRRVWAFKPFGNLTFSTLGCWIFINKTSEGVNDLLNTFEFFCSHLFWSFYISSWGRRLWAFTLYTLIWKTHNSE